MTLKEGELPFDTKLNLIHDRDAEAGSVYAREG
jgi:hypothetical protein